MNPVIIIPCYRHGEILAGWLPELLNCGLPVIIVDDGNAVPLREVIKLGAHEGITVLRREANGGKGQAMRDGFREAWRRGFSHALQIDADGQHDFQKIPDFISLARQHPGALISGKPVYSNVPPGRFIARYITHFWVALELGRFSVVDSMCGMRVYPLDRVLCLLDKRSLASGMGFDTEIMVRLFWAGADIIEEPVAVRYPRDGISNFRMLRDNLDLACSHTRLCCEKVLNYFRVRRRDYL